MPQNSTTIATILATSSVSVNAGCRRQPEAAVAAPTHRAGPDDLRSAGDGACRSAGDQEREREQVRRINFYAAVLAMACHDLRQPLQVIVGSHELLAQKLATAPERRYLDYAQRAGAELAGKLEQLVDVLRVQHQLSRRRLEPIPLRPLLQGLAHQLDEMARQRGIALRFLRTDAMVVSDAVMLDGILRNLIRNALEHIAPGGRVLVGCRRRGAEVRVEVRDNGAGIFQEQLPLLFEAFVRIDKALPEGLGLGLFIVKQAADYLGHRVEVRSAPGQGCCFAIAAQAADRHCDN